MISMVELTTRITNLTASSVVLFQVNALNRKDHVLAAVNFKDIDTINLLSERPGL